MRTRTEVEIVATGFENPRGLAFGPDGFLYVAEGGRGGSSSTVGTHRQIPPPVGPYTGGMTGRISRMAVGGVRETVAEGLPSSQSTPQSGGSVSGVAAVAFVGEKLYALVSGGGASHGLPDAPNGVYGIEGGHGALLADLGRYRASTTVANPDPNDDEYDGTWYSMVEAHGSLWAVEPNHGVIVRVDTDGTVERLVDISASQGHIVPTALAYGRDADAFFVGNLGRLPARDGSSSILRIDRNGDVQPLAEGLTMVVGLAFDPSGVLYALELSTCGGEPCRPRPGAGRVVRVGRAGALEPVAENLMFPTALVADPIGNALYLSIGGLGKPGSGAIGRLAL